MARVSAQERRCSGSGETRAESVPEAGACGRQFGLDETSQLLLEFLGDVVAAQLVGETHRLLVGVDEGQAARAIREVLLELLADGRLQTLLNVLIQQLTDITTSKHAGDLG